MTPDDDHHYPNTTCHHCHNLQHYLLNVTKYFTSNTQLLFLPGVHYLHTDLIIQNVHNISLIGNTSYDSIPVNVVYCNSTGQGIEISNSSVVTIKDFLITKCAKRNNVFVKFVNCYRVQLHSTIMDAKFIGKNIMGNSILSEFVSNRIYISYDDAISVETDNNKLEIVNYMHMANKPNYLTFKLEQMFYGVLIAVSNSVFLHNVVLLMSITSSCMTQYESAIIFNRTQFLNVRNIDYLIHIEFNSHGHCFNKTVIRHSKIFFDSCTFESNLDMFSVFYGKWVFRLNDIGQNLIIANCIFKNNIVSESLLNFYSKHIPLLSVKYIQLTLISYQTNVMEIQHNQQCSTITTA